MSGLLAAAHLGAISEAAAGSLIAAVWQGVLLAAIAGLALRLLPKTPAAVRFAIWFGVFALVTALPLIALLPHAANAPQTAHSGAAWLVLDTRWCLAIAAVWALASLVRAATLAVAAIRVRSLWKRAMPVDVLRPALRGEAAKDGAPELFPAGETRRAAICVSDEVDRPTVIGFFAPKILIPGWLMDKLTPAELEQVVLHEAGHLGRADDWMNLLQKVALVLFPLNPALAWIERRLCFERELACDERVLLATGAPKAYAACLATLAEYRLERRSLMHGLALALGALGRESELSRRVGRILLRGESMKPAQARLVFSGAMLALLVGVVSLAHSPELVAFAPADAANPFAARTAAAAAPLVSAHPYRVQSVVFRESTAQARVAHPSQPHREGWVAFTPPQTRIPYVSPLRRVSEPLNIAQTAHSEMPSASTASLRWVMVTAFQNADGTRLVMTTEGLSPSARRAAIMPQSDEAPVAPPDPRSTQPATQALPISQQQSSPPLYPYAAVPVRGGWLIVQM